MVSEKEAIAKEIKKLIRTPHGHFIVHSNSDRTRALLLGESWRIGGFIDFHLSSRRLEDGSIKIFRV